MTDRTKIERVGGHLLIGEFAAVSLHALRIDTGYDAAGRGCLVVNGEPAIGWTAREILEVAYDRDESAALRAQYEIVQTQNAELRAKSDENKVLREALRRVVDHLAVEASNGDGIAEEAVDDFITAKMLATGIERMPEAESRGLASIREAAGAER